MLPFRSVQLALTLTAVPWREAELAWVHPAWLIVPLSVQFQATTTAE